MRFLCVLLIAGCAATAGGPVFDPAVQRSFRDEGMRRMETGSLIVYYPVRRQAQAERMAARFETCAAELRARAIPGAWKKKLVVILPEVVFNNAYVMSMGYRHMVVPTAFTSGMFTDMGMPPDPGTVGCHEIAHYVHGQQVHGLYWLLETVFGEGSFNPQAGLDSWFWEGLATNYETRLAPGRGRMASPYFRQTFASGMADERWFHGGLLHVYQREVPMGAQYLIGAHFVEFLIERYGEKRLWMLVDRQARSVLSPALVSPRFFAVYGKNLSVLLDEFAADVRRRHRPRARPPEQQVLVRLGELAKLGMGRDGSLAIVDQGVDQVPTLVVIGPDGRRRLERRLPDMLPPRQIHVGWLEGLSFSPGGNQLYFTSWDITESSWATHLMRLDIDTDRLTMVRPDINGAAGALTPDGRRYVFPRADGDRHDLVAVDVVTGGLSVLAMAPPGTYFALPQVSPDGRRIAVMVTSGGVWDVLVLDATSGQPLERLTAGETSSYDPWWIDDDRVVYLEEIDGRLQPVVKDVRGGPAVQVANAPYLADTPRSVDGRSLVFLNRDGWKWTLDRVPLALPARAEVAVAGDVAATVEDAAVAPAGDKAAPPLQVLSDRPYSQLDGLFLPRLRMPLTVGFSSLAGTVVSGIVSGNDQLGFHSWALTLTYLSADSGILDGALTYTNGQLAPWLLMLQLSKTTEFLDAVDDDPDADGTRRELAGRLIAARSYWDIQLLTSFDALDLRDDPDADTGVEALERRFVGPRVELAYAVGRGTDHAGAREALGLGLSGAYYAESLASTFDLGDGRAALLGVVPLPLSRRHSLRLLGRARVLTGVPDDQRLLTVGGMGGAYGLWSSRELGTAETDYVLPTGMVFSEPLRGYEDAPFLANRVLVADASYTYPLILDWGTASTLWVLPSLLVRQLDLEAFASVATTLDADRHAAVGGGAALRLAVWLAPLTLRYQAARRLDDDEALAHLFTLSLE